MIEDLLIIFVRNPELHKVKTRLAKTLGPEKALAIYKNLLQRTHTITQGLPLTKIVYYAAYIPDADIWEAPDFAKALQQGADLGERMHQAFAAGFANHFRRICIIGSDCYELTPKILQNAFLNLKQQEVVLGPATDGGYYLLGMNNFYPELFQGITWSSALVLDQTIKAAYKRNLTLTLLPTLTDVDEEKDLVTMLEND